MKVDYLIVGQGLAGSLLAFEFYRLGKTFLVIDNPEQQKASNVAAGLINPVGFKRMTKSWMVDEAFPQMETTFKSLEKLLNDKFYYPSEIQRILTKDETLIWKEKAISNKLESYLNPEIQSPDADQSIHSPYGIGQVITGGKLNIQKLIAAFAGFLHNNSLLRKEYFDFNCLNIHSGLVNYKEISAEKLIFCEGAAVSKNPYFNAIKFKHSKGEILELEIPDLKIHQIISGDVFLMPIAENQYKVGATYSWDNLDWETSENARIELTDKLHRMLSLNYLITSQKAGIRPTTNDRKPVMGFHPDFLQIGIFNGLGPRGILLGPYFARQFSEYISGHSFFIHPEVNISRYFRTK